MSLLEVVAAALLLLGSALVIQALLAADAFRDEAAGMPEPRKASPTYRRAA